MKLTVENAIKIAEKYNFAYDEDLQEIIIPIRIVIDDDDFSFMRFISVNDDLEYSCAYEFGVTALESGKFGFHTTTFRNITTTEEFEETLKIFCFLLN